MTRKKRPVVLLGAYDRFNYGDLLFPLVIRRELGRRDDKRDFLIHGLKASDLRRWGGLPTESLRRLMIRFPQHERIPVIIAGGGLLGASWTGMLVNLLPPPAKIWLYYLGRLIGKRRIERLAASWLGGRSPHPWIMSPAHFPFTATVHYNAVGGSELARMAPDMRKSALAALAQAAHLSVRDDETATLLAPLGRAVDVHLVPDSAILMSEYHPLADLERSVRPHVRDLVAGQEPYLCFHAAPNYVAAFEDAIRVQIETICKREGLRCILLPIARYSGLDDAKGLDRIPGKLKAPIVSAGADCTIGEIMYVIAKAAVFCGTSLHGNITAQSFALPHIGLSLRPCKVDYYLRTWDLEEQAQCPSIENLARSLRRACSVSAERRRTLRQDLIAASQANFDRLDKAIRGGMA